MVSVVGICASRLKETKLRAPSIASCEQMSRFVRLDFEQRSDSLKSSN